MSLYYIYLGLNVCFILQSGAPSRPINVMYVVGGHKLYAAKLPSSSELSINNNNNNSNNNNNNNNGISNNNGGNSNNNIGNSQNNFNSMAGLQRTSVREYDSNAGKGEVSIINNSCYYYFIKL